MAGIGFHCGKCRNGIAPPSRTPWTAATWVAASVTVVQLAATVCHGVVSAAFWMATGLGWSSLNPPAPEKRQSSAARLTSFWSPTTANSSTRLLIVLGLRPPARAPCSNADDQFWVLDGGSLGTPAVAVLPGELSALWTAGSHENGRRRRRQVVKFELIRLKIAAREADSLPAPQLPHQLDGLDQSIVPFSVGPELGGPCLLVESFTGANTQEDPLGRQHGERGERLGDRCGMVAVDRAGHAGPVGDPTGSPADHCQSEPWKHRVGLVVLPRLLMSAGPRYWNPASSARCAWSISSAVVNCSCDSTKPTPTVAEGGGPLAVGCEPVGELAQTAAILPVPPTPATSRANVRRDSALIRDAYPRFLAAYPTLLATTSGRSTPMTASVHLSALRGPCGLARGRPVMR